MSSGIVTLVFILASALATNASAAGACAAQFASHKDCFVNIALNQDPRFLGRLTQVVSQSEFRNEIESVPGFNDRIISTDASELEKLIRQETPYTVSLIGRDVVNQAGRLARFRQFGLVVGDPHFGNFNIQPILFQNGFKDQNRYTVVDLDEVSIGVFSLDLARYTIFLKARLGDLSNFGGTFVEELFDAYMKGLNQEAKATPTFIADKLGATAEEIRQKVDDYADKRVNGSGKFHARDFASRELLEFQVKNMKPEFLKNLKFDPRTDDHGKLKKTLIDFFEKSLKDEKTGQIELLDVAIPPRESGGSALRQRFIVSISLTVDGLKQRMIVEFKENSPQNAWQAVIKGPQKTAERYEMALNATMQNPGHFLKVVDFNGRTSFLMRARGNQDIESKKRSQLRELALYNAYMMGQFHGGQGDAVSGSYRKEVGAYPLEFRKLVLGMTDEVLSKLVSESGLQIPH